MIIVNIEDFFHPNAGYQINILSKYLSSFGHKVYIITSKLDKIPDNLTSFFGKNDIEKYDSEYEKITGVKIIRLPIKAFISGRAVFTSLLKKTVEGLNPDILFVHGNDTLSGMTFLHSINKLKYPVVCDSHMLEMASTNKLKRVFRLFYKSFITPKLIKYQVPVIRTQDDPYVEKCLGIPLKQAPWISYGSDTMLFYPDLKQKAKFKNVYDIPYDAFVIIYAGKLDESKGGKFLADALKAKFNCKRQLCFVLVGNTIGDYGKDIEKCLAESENVILRFPTQRYTDLAKFYQSADLAIFPKQCSLSFYDVQACGLPVLSEDNNINIDRCSHSNGWNFKSEDIQDFRNKIELIADMKIDEYKKIAKNAYDFILKNYNYEDKAREYEEILVKEFDRFRRGEK